jgi:hypothetical protein
MTALTARARGHGNIVTHYTTWSCRCARGYLVLRSNFAVSDRTTSAQIATSQSEHDYWTILTSSSDYTFHDIT